MDDNRTASPMFVVGGQDEILFHFALEVPQDPFEIGEIMCDFRVQSGHLIPFAIWLGERRHLWSDWWRLGERDGRAALGAHVKDLSLKTPRESLRSFDVDYYPDFSHINLVAEFVDRTAVLATHRFDTADETKRLLVAYKQATDDIIAEVFNTACLLPSRRLDMLIARMVGANRDRSVHGRRGGWSRTTH